MYEALADSAEIVAGVLGIAVTVVAIIVELAATRYNHRITDLFIREPVNVLVLSFFVATTLMCIWVSAVSNPADSSWLHSLTMIMITVALLILLPYFAYVFSFISPINVIKRISAGANARIRAFAKSADASQRLRAAEAIDEVQDVMRSAIDTGDRDIAMNCVETLTKLLIEYQRHREILPEPWYDMDATAAADPDFVSLEPSALQHIAETKSWFEYKVLSQFHSTVGSCIPNLREVANLISIKTRLLAIEVAEPGSALLDLCLIAFNSYLRTTIVARDPRTAYYILSQYRMVAEELAQKADTDRVATIARRFQFYGQLGFNTGQPFLLEVCAFDLVQLLDSCIDNAKGSIDCLLDALLELDREIRSETQEASLTGVRRAQLHAAAILLEAGDEARADRVIADLMTENQTRINRIISQLQEEGDRQYWELTPRGINFSYLEPERRSFLETIRARLNSN
ncbi:MAG: DUF2254 domain-containing protein [Gammaproteobacteria bacterium]|nr:DUF2254 domain-containing protein [Gammaproteobacteria bacterium]